MAAMAGGGDDVDQLAPKYFVYFGVEAAKNILSLVLKVILSEDILFYAFFCNKIKSYPTLEALHSKKFQETWIFAFVALLCDIPKFHFFRSLEHCLAAEKGGKVYV